MSDSLNDLAAELEQFANDREWKQFHAPKNLACALSVEAGELLELFQWMPDHESRALSDEKLAAVSHEVADILLYLIQLSASLGIDPIAAAQAKLHLNAQRYPIANARGNSKKYDEF